LKEPPASDYVDQNDRVRRGRSISKPAYLEILISLDLFNGAIFQDRAGFTDAIDDSSPRRLPSVNCFVSLLSEFSGAMNPQGNGGYQRNSVRFGSITITEVCTILRRQLAPLTFRRLKKFGDVDNYLPFASSFTSARSIGRGAGPSKLTPSLSYPLP